MKRILKAVFFGAPDSRAAYELQLKALLQRNQQTTGNFSEAGWLQAQIDAAQAQLGRL